MINALLYGSTWNYTTADEVHFIHELAKQNPAALNNYAAIVLNDCRRFDKGVNVTTVKLALRRALEVEPPEHPMVLAGEGFPVSPNSNSIEPKTVGVALGDSAKTTADIELVAPGESQIEGVME